MGSGYRGTLDQLDAATLTRVRTANIRFVRESGLSGIETNVIYAMAIKPD